MLKMNPKYFYVERMLPVHNKFILINKIQGCNQGKTICMCCGEKLGYSIPEYPQYIHCVDCLIEISNKDVKSIWNSNGG